MKKQQSHRIYSSGFHPNLLSMSTCSYLILAQFNHKCQTRGTFHPEHDILNQKMVKYARPETNNITLNVPGSIISENLPLA